METINKRTRIIYGIVLMTIVSSCGVSQSDYDKLKEENERLQYIEERLVANVEEFYNEKNYIFARHNIEMLNKIHPESPKNEEFKELLKVIEKEELEQKKDIFKGFRLIGEIMANKGMWSVRNYVDEFGEPKMYSYVTNTSLIHGTFSNYETQDSKLDVRFLIRYSHDILIRLYDSGENKLISRTVRLDENHTLHRSRITYTVLIQDKDGYRTSLIAVYNTLDGLRFDETESQKIHNVLMTGGTIKFKITDTDYPTIEYQFTIQNADGYEGAYLSMDKEQEYLRNKEWNKD